MNESAAREAYDLKERARIQQALRRYMEAHRIGTPTLQLRIMEADARGRELPLSTLQRFVTGSHRTSDAYVDMCRRFLESLGAQDEAAEFDGLHGFFGRAAAPDQQTEVVAFLEERVAGEYESRTRPSTQGGQMPCPPESPLVASRASFAAGTGKPYLEVREFVPDHMNTERAPHRRSAYEGALISAPPLMHIFLRSALTRQPKTYTLALAEIEDAPEGVTVLEGELFEPMFLHDDPRRQRLARNERVQFVPRQKSEAGP